MSSGVVGLLAFAMQMAKVATQVKQAVELFKSAPSEMTDLLQRLTLLQTMCKLVEVKVAGSPDHQPGGSSSASLGAISTALLQCQDKMEELSRTLSATGLTSSQTKTPLSRSEAFSRLRFVLRRDKVKSMVQDVDHVISRLHIVLTVDTWMAIVPNPQTPRLSQPDNAHGEISNLQEETPSGVEIALSPRPAVPVFRRKARREKRHRSRYMGLVTWTTVESWIEDQGDGSKLMPDRRGDVSLKVPFSSIQIDFHYTQFMGTPSYALNINHVIDENSGLAVEIRSVMYLGDLPKLKELLSDRQMSIYSTYADRSLFWWSVDTRWAEGFKYLLDHDFRQKFLEEEPSSKPVWKFSSHLSNKTCEVTEMVLSLRQEDTRAQDVRTLLESSSDPAYYESYLKRFLEDRAICDKHDLVKFAWRQVARNIIFLVRDPDRAVGITSWSAALRCLIEHGADIHQLGNVVDIESPRGSTYLDILLLADSPIDADECLYEWLRTLKSCGVLIGPYIERETRILDRFYDDTHWGVSTCCIRLATIQFEGIPTPSWRWSVSPGDEAFELLKEVENLVRNDLYVGFYYPYIIKRNDFTAWFESNMPDEYRQRSFPYRPTPLDHSWSDYRMDESYYHTYKMALKVREGRLARREARKWRKSHRGEKPSTRMMPGSWMD